MDIFQIHQKLLERNREIFEKNRNTFISEFETDEKMKGVYNKKGKEFLSMDQMQYFMEVRSIYYRNVLEKRIEEYGFFEWLVCLEENVILEYAIPVFAKVLKEYPMLCGFHNEWEVLCQISRINQNFWNKHKEWMTFFICIIDDILTKYFDGGEVDIPLDCVKQLKDFASLKCINSVQ